MIKAIIFDCYGVFYVDPVLGYVNDPSSPPEKAKALHDLDQRMIVGDISDDDFQIQAGELLGMTKEEVHTEFFVPHARNQSLLDYAQSLRKDYKIGMLSNADSTLMEPFFTRTEQDKYFDAVVLSGDVGVAKPNPRVFQMMAEKLGVAPDEAVMIDDLPAFCDGARAVGMQAIAYNSNAQLRADLGELLA